MKTIGILPERVALIFMLFSINGLFGDNSPKDICTVCFCDSGIEPYYINCEKLHLTSLPTEGDWNYTFEQNKIDRKNVTFDIRFDENEITHIPTFPPLLPIAQMSFRNNRLTSIEPYAFRELTDLVSLDLSGNLFTAKDLPELVFEGKTGEKYYKPLSLQSLNVSNNNIHTIEQDLFDHLPNLTSLDISHNPLKILGGSTGLAIADLSSLEYLNLAYTGINKIPEGMLHSLMHLMSLDLSGNDFTTIPEELRNTHSLKVLILDDNQFESFDANSFTGLKNLEEISISYMKSLRLIEGKTFGEMKKLIRFYCHHNQNLDRISNAAFYEIATTKEDWPVKEILLNDNALTHIDHALAPWEAVSIINIQNNPFICNCDLRWMAENLVDQIRRTKPELVKDIVCAGPTELKGGSIVELGLEPESFERCKEGGYKLNGEKYIRNDSVEGQYVVHQSTAVTVLVIGIILVAIGLSILAVLIIKRRAIALALVSHQEIRYQRAHDDDFDSQVTYKSPSSSYRV